MDSNFLVNIVREGDLASLERYILTFRHIDLTIRNSHGQSLIYLACNRGFDLILERLLSASKLSESEVGILLNTEGLLVIAADNGHSECCKILLSHSCIDPNQTFGANGTTALHKATARGHTQVCRVILEYADNKRMNLENATTDLGNTAIHVAVESNRMEILRLLLQQQNTPTNVANISGATPLITAVSYARVDMVKALLSAGADVNARAEGDLGTALYCACSHSIAADAALQIVNALLQQSGINVNLEERANGDTPLVAACRRGDEALCQLLLRHNETQSQMVTEFINEDADEKDESKTRNLYMPEIIMRANINKATFSGETALMAASKRGHSNIVHRLLENEELDINAQNLFGITALSMASRKGHTEVVRTLAGRENRRTSLKCAQKAAQGDEIKEILRAAADAASVTDQAGCKVAWYSHLKILETFLSPQKK